MGLSEIVKQSVILMMRMTRQYLHKRENSQSSVFFVYSTCSTFLFVFVCMQVLFTKGKKYTKKDSLQKYIQHLNRHIDKKRNKKLLPRTSLLFSFVSCKKDNGFFLQTSQLGCWISCCKRVALLSGQWLSSC